MFAASREWNGTEDKPEQQPLKTIEFNSSIYSTPTIANGVIFVSDRSRLYAFKTQ